MKILLELESRQKSGKQKSNVPKTNPHSLPRTATRPPSTPRAGRRSACGFHARVPRARFLHSRGLVRVVRSTSQQVGSLVWVAIGLGLKATHVAVSLELHGSGRRSTRVPCLPSRVLPPAIDTWLSEFLLSPF